jgi:purine catabolism regulator
LDLLVEDVLNLECMKTAQVIAGETGLKNKVSNTTIMDVPEINKWLHEEEMIFVAGLFQDCANENFFISLNKKSVAAIVTKPAYVSKLDDNLKELCNKLYLPIIIVDQNTSWNDITYPITRIIANKQYDVIYQSQLFHSELMNSLIHDNSISQLCNVIYSISGLTAAIVDIDFNISGCSANFDWKKALKGFSLQYCHYKSILAKDIKGNSTSGYIYNNIYLNSINKHILIFPVTQDSRTYCYIFLLKDMKIEFLDITESMKVSQLTLVISLIKVKQFEMTNINRRYNNLVLDLIIQGRLNTHERNFVENSIQHTFSNSYYIVMANSNDFSGTTNIIEYSVRTSNLFEIINKNKVEFENVLCFERGDNLVFLIPESEISINRTIKELYSICKKILETNSLHFGISDITEYTDFPCGFEQALQALKYAQSYSKSNYVFYNDLGILRFFIERKGHLNEYALIELKKKYIDPLREYDNKNSTQLEETLYCLVECDYSKVDTANKLYIHRNTLRARISKIEEILNCSLNNSEDMFNIQLAMKIEYCLDK